MATNFLTYQLEEKFHGKEYITRDELYEFYRLYEPDLSPATFSWRIHNLKEKNILQSVKRSIYTLMGKKLFQPTTTPKLKALGIKVTKEFPAANNCVWSTRWLNEWTIHQSGRFLTVVEVEASATESVFYFLKDANYKNVFLNPTEDIIEKYIYEHEETIIVKTLVTKAPIQQKKHLSVPTLEKILVDLFIDKKLYVPFQGGELINIFNTVYINYGINITKMLRYAKRRGKGEAMIEFITKNTLLKELVD